MTWNGALSFRKRQEVLTWMTTFESSPIKFDFGGLFLEFQNASKDDFMSFKKKYELPEYDYQSALDDILFSLNMFLSNRTPNEEKSRCKDMAVDPFSSRDFTKTGIFLYKLFNTSDSIQILPDLEHEISYKFISSDIISLIKLEIFNCIKEGHNFIKCYCGKYYIKKPKQHKNHCPNCAPPSRQPGLYLDKKRKYMKEYRKKHHI